jgi:predicted nucleotidyltransferase
MLTEITPRFGLKETTIDRINTVFSRYPDIKQVVLYGSRAKGNYQNGSDIDLTLIGDALSHAQLTRIETQIDDLLLPYSVDLSLFKHIDNVNLIDHIQRIGTVFYSR